MVSVLRPLELASPAHVIPIKRHDGSRVQHPDVVGNSYLNDPKHLYLIHSCGLHFVNYHVHDDDNSPERLGVRNDRIDKPHRFRGDLRRLRGAHRSLVHPCGGRGPKGEDGPLVQSNWASGPRRLTHFLFQCFLPYHLLF